MHFLPWQKDEMCALEKTYLSQVGCTTEQSSACSLPLLKWICSQTKPIRPGHHTLINPCEISVSLCKGCKWKHIVWNVVINFLLQKMCLSTWAAGFLSQHEGAWHALHVGFNCSHSVCLYLLFVLLNFHGVLYLSTRHWHLTVFVIDHLPVSHLFTRSPVKR